jgi:hypothetical protein
MRPRLLMCITFLLLFTTSAYVQSTAKWSALGCGPSPWRVNEVLEHVIHRELIRIPLETDLLPSE